MTGAQRAPDVHWETINAYRTIYFPAQEIHFRRDDPRRAATVIVGNDPRLGTSVQRVN